MTKWALVEDVALEALQKWLASPGSDVEKILRRVMRAHNKDLDHEERKDIAGCVLGVTVLWGRLAHLLEREVRSGAGSDAQLLLQLFIARERGGCREDGQRRSMDSADVDALAVATHAPLFRAEECPSSAARLAAVWSLPLWLATRWVDELGAPTAFALGKAMSMPARITLRANVLKTTRLDLLESFAAIGVPAIPTAESRWGLWLPDGRPPNGGVWQLPGWNEGLFELQDEGSQLVALATEALPGESAVDYCAGRGGKTWVLAALVAPSGSVLAWDIDEDLRRELRGGRMERAGATNLVHVPEKQPMPKVSGGGTADVVLVDAPCSSSGVLRRHPSQRWSLNEDSIEKIVNVQLSVLQEAAALVRPGGRLVYATCSLLHAENRGVADAFEAASGGEFQPWPFSTIDATHHRTLLPHVHGTDGFFMARWKKCDGVAMDQPETVVDAIVEPGAQN